MPYKTYLTFLLLIANFVTYSQDIEAQRLNYNIQDISSFNKVVVKNLYGDIRVRQTKQDSIVYHAVSQFSKTHQAKLFHEIKNNTLFLEIKYVNPPSIDSKERVDVAIILPKEIDLEVFIEKGNLSTKTIANRLKVVSQHSNISVKSKNSADISTISGDVTFILMPHKKSKTINLKSQNGSIRVDYEKRNIPRADIITGSIVTSNSIRFLKNKTKKKRVQQFRPKKSFDIFKIQSDTGYIHFIEHKAI
jgi:hypothetical protein